MDFMGAGEQSYGKGIGQVSSGVLSIKTDTRPQRRVLVAQPEIILHAGVNLLPPRSPIDLGLFLEDSLPNTIYLQLLCNRPTTSQFLSGKK